MKELRIMILILSFSLLLMGFMFGTSDGSKIGYYGKLDGCQYKSILSRVIFTYYIGCELTRPRFNNENK